MIVVILHKERSVKLGAGQDLHRRSAGGLATKPWKSVIDPSVDHFFGDGNSTDGAEVQMIYAMYYLCSL